MKFKALPVTSLEDVTVDLEQLSAKDILDQSGESVLQLLATGTKRQLAMGSNNVVFTASNVSASLTFAHGLGRTPLIVVPVATTTIGVIMTPTAVTTSNVTVFGSYPFGTLSATVGFWWLAIG